MIIGLNSGNTVATVTLGTGSNGGGGDFELVVLDTGSNAGGGGFALADFIPTPTVIERRRRLPLSSVDGGCSIVATLGSELRTLIGAETLVVFEAEVGRHSPMLGLTGYPEASSSVVRCSYSSLCTASCASTWLLARATNEQQSHEFFQPWNLWNRMWNWRSPRKKYRAGQYGQNLSSGSSISVYFEMSSGLSLSLDESNNTSLPESDKPLLMAVFLSNIKLRSSSITYSRARI
ncbi:hypothetical protein AGLY_015346 [Aphis glycines]|uniref:Uncharacterized protein n=1 Tax=Aphis glycines TaxID=307491 RepID=A0A6G0T326_APHGL|nr:hypothetical protein AGLY_015346 [Aphis glycines]